MGVVDVSQLVEQRMREWYLLEKARRAEQPKKPAAEPQPLPVITISRQFGAGGHTVAERLLGKLSPKWQIWDKQIIEAIAHNAKVRTEMVEALDERAQSRIEQAIRTLATVPVLEPLAYHRHLAQVLLAVAQQGYKIIVGRGANFVLPEALNVRLRASLEYRVRTTMQRENIPHEEALRQVQRVDRDRAIFTRSVFGHEVDDPNVYDMVLQVDTLGIDACVSAILAAAQARFGSLM